MIRLKVRQRIRVSTTKRRNALAVLGIKEKAPPREEGPVILQRSEFTAARMITKAWTQHTMHPEQARLWTTNKRFAFVPAGRGSGKTEIAKRRLVRFLPVRKPWDDPRYFYTAPTYPQAKRIAWNSLQKLIPKGWIRPGGINHSDLCITTIWGSELWVVGLDKPQRIEGLQWDGGVIDESSDIKPKTFDLSIAPSLTWRDGWCWRIGVPKRYGVGAAEFRAGFEAAKKGELPDTDGFTWSSEEVLPASAIAWAKGHLDMKDYLEQFCANWVSAGGAIFYAFDEEINKRPCSYNPSLPLMIGSDFNVDPMAWVICHRYIDPATGGDYLEVIDELFMRDANTYQALTVLYERYGHHRGGFEFYGDATGRARKTSAVTSDYGIIQSDIRFADLGRTIHYTSANPPQADRFAAMNALIRTADGKRRFFVNPNCKHLIDDLNTRTYKPGTREAQDEGDQGHITDALGYIIHRLWPIRIPLDAVVSRVGTQAQGVEQ